MVAELPGSSSQDDIMPGAVSELMVCRGGVWGGCSGVGGTPTRWLRVPGGFRQGWKLRRKTEGKGILPLILLPDFERFCPLRVR